MSRPDPDAKIALPITPMLDMVFQLLFFFIMNFNPADLEGQMEAALPAQDVPGCRLGPQHRRDDLPKAVVPELPIVLTIEVRTRPEGGAISALSVRGADGKSVFVDGLDGLRDHLASRRSEPGDKAVLKIRADARLSVEHLMRVIDTCKAAGFANTALESPE